MPKAKTVVGIGIGTPATVNESLGALFSGGMPCKPSDVKALGIKPLVSASSGSIETTSISSRFHHFHFRFRFHFHYDLLIPSPE